MNATLPILITVVLLATAAEFACGFSFFPSKKKNRVFSKKPESTVGLVCGTRTIHKILYSTVLPELEAAAGSSDQNEWKTTLEKDGVVKIDSALSPDLADAYRYSLEDQKILAWFAGMEGPEVAAERAFYGPRDDEEKNCELQLSLLRGGYAADNAKNISDTERHILADVLVDVFGPTSGSLTNLVESLVTSEGELYELTASMIDTGNAVQEGAVKSYVERESAADDIAPLYSILLALQDIDETMAPMTFYMNTHSTGEAESQSSSRRLATMKKGDAIIFDARILMSPKANAGATYTMLNIALRNPTIDSDLGYLGSLRPGYRGALNLGDLKKSLLAYENGDGNAFQKYGDGIRKPYHNVDAYE